MNYQYKVTFKVLLMLAITLIGIPAYFIMGGSIQMAIVFTLYGIITNALGQIAYHRWLAHDQFVPNIVARYAMIFGTIVCGNGNHIHNVYAHLNHHKYADTDKDTHNPQELGFLKMWLGWYKTPTDYFSMRKLLQKRDVVFASKNYWKLYAVISVLHFLITPWLVVWQAFNFTHMWIGLNWLNYAGHGHGKTGEPSKITGFLNHWMMGEGNHDVHHKSVKKLDMSEPGNVDWAGRYLIPMLLAK
tara:strand:+ start:237 stop:968 length:732 start_codon:yes stop_codon:yes gene_type:complete